LLPSYFDHDAFLHHALHILDAPGLRYDIFVLYDDCDELDYQPVLSLTCRFMI